jgi:tetratricopeptide (TPR) repeat protein
LLDWVERQGAVVITADCYPSEQQLAYAPVAKWLRNDNFQPIFHRLDNRLLTECSRLLPELQESHPDLPAPGPLGESWQRQHFFRSLARTVLRLRQPLLLFVDDLQWCDQETLDWLQFLIHYDSRSRFLLIVAVRSEEITPDHQLKAWQQQLEREGRLTDIKLEPLDARSATRLAESVLRRKLDNQQATLLFAETEGNPLFVVEMARSDLLARQVSAHSPALPPRARAVIETRLTSLAPSTCELAQLAAVIGRSFTFSLLNQASAQEEDDIIRGLDEMWQRRIIRERDIDAYDFSHDKIRQVAYDSLSQARRRQLHQQVWRALETLHAEDLDSVSGQIARHCEIAGHYQEALHHYRRAARAAQAIYANHDARRYLQRAIELFSKAEPDPHQQSVIYEALADSLLILGHYDEAKGALEAAIDLTADPWRLSSLHLDMAVVTLVQRDYSRVDLALDDAEEALQRASQAPPEPWWQRWIDIRLSRLSRYYFANQVQEMAQLSEEIGPVIERYGSPVQSVRYYGRLTQLGYRQERSVLSDEVLNYAQKACAAVENSDELLMLASYRFLLGFSYLWHGWCGDLDEAERYLQAALDAAEEMGDVLLRTRCLNYLALVYRRRGDRQRVAELLPQVLAIAEEGDLQEYTATVEANMAWLKWLAGDLQAAEAHGERALATWRGLAIVMPMQWTALWPLMAVALAQDEVERAAGYAQALLSPDMARLPDDLTAILQQAITASADHQPAEIRNKLQTALDLASQLKQV